MIAQQGRKTQPCCLKRCNVSQPSTLFGGVFVCDFKAVLYRHCVRAVVRLSCFPAGVMAVITVLHTLSGVSLCLVIGKFFVNAKTGGQPDG